MGKSNKLVLATGGFDPCHRGHIAYLKAAKELGSILIVGLNSDVWLERKKGAVFMPFKERAAIIESLKFVDAVIDFDDADDTAKNAIRAARENWTHLPIVFANGGDRTSSNIPEMCDEFAEVEFVFGVGGDTKQNSSSWILKNWQAPLTPRLWGHYRTLYSVGTTTKVKELVVEPGQSLSMQKHQDRQELWLVAQGTATVWTMVDGDQHKYLHGKFATHTKVHIEDQMWHQLENEGTEPLHIIEIQYGKLCKEEDITRIYNIEEKK